MAVGRPDDMQNRYRTGEEGNVIGAPLEKRFAISLWGNVLYKL